MTDIEKTSSLSEKISEKSKGLAELLFKVDGKINRLQYLGSKILLSLFVLLAGFTGEPVFAFLVEFVCVYCFLILCQKRSRDMGEKGTLYIVLLLSAVFLKEYYDTFHLEDTFLALPCNTIFFFAAVAGLRLLLTKGKENADMQNKSPLTKYPLLTVLVYFVVFFLLLVFADFIIPGRAKKTEILNEATVSLYEQVEGYPAVCKEYGYELKVYPNRFVKELSSEIGFLEQESVKAGFALKETYDMLKASENFNKKVETAIKGSLEKLRLRIIVDFLAEKQNVRSQDVEWEDEYNNLLPTGAACRYLDELAESDNFFSAPSYLHVKNIIAKYKAL